jgi:MarR family transcriptional regulator, temperature-dependent positive regulator of motility
MPELSEELRYRLLKILAEQADVSQREVAQALGVSVGKVNYCLRALIDRGLVKLRNFAQSGDRRRYTYVLTARGLRERAHATRMFLRLKLKEYEQVHRELRTLRQEVEQLGTEGDKP